jgi:Legionella pneumophila major outer membrane protein precursor
MPRFARTRCLVVAIWLVLTALSASRCPAQDLPPAPVPATQPSPPPSAPAPPVPVAPLIGPYVPVQPLPPAPPPPELYPYDRYDPPFETVPTRPPGVFAGIEADLVWPHIKNRLTAPVVIDDFIDSVHLPTASLDFTGSPKVILGYRFAPGYGEFTASYRSLVTEGTRNIADFDIAGDGFLKSRLNMNVIDLDYGSQEIPLASAAPGQLWDLKFDVGARIAGVYFDSTASGFILNQRTSNNFFGAGPHLALEGYRYLQDFDGVALFARVEGAVVIGRVHQRFQESAFLLDETLSGSTSQSSTQAVPVLGFEAGVTWTPLHNWRWIQFAGGYTFEQWWGVGTAGGARADLTSQGLFLRTELHF